MSTKIILLIIILIVGNGSLIGLWYQLRHSIKDDKTKKNVNRNLILIGVVMSACIILGSVI
jgi:hypothetical protein